MTCLLCRKKGTGQFIVVTRHNMSFHKECFRCSDCNKPLNPESHFIAKGNSLFLPACYERFVVGTDSSN